MRWLLLVSTLLAWVLCFSRHGAGAFVGWLLVGLAGAIATALAFAQARIEARERPEIVAGLLRQPPAQDKSPQA